MTRWLMLTFQSIQVGCQVSRASKQMTLTLSQKKMKISESIQGFAFSIWKLKVIILTSNFKCCLVNHSLHIFKIYAMKTMMEVIQPPLHMQRKSFKHILGIQSNQYFRRHIVCVSCQVSCNFFTLIQLVIRCLILNFGASPSSFQSSYSRTNIMRNNDNP